MSREKSGDTNSEESAGRRVFIKNFPSNSKLNDYKKFFKNVKEVDGFHVNKKFAIITFKTPIDYSRALARNGETYMGKVIHISPYKLPKPVQKNTRERTPSPPRFLQRRSRTRSRSRSRSWSPPRRRGRSSNPEERQTDRRSDRRHSSDRGGNLDSDDMGRKRRRNGHDDSNPNRVPSRDDNRESVPKQSDEWTERPSEMFQTLLPDDIAQIMKLALHHKTIRILEYRQIDKLIRFLVNERTRMEQLNPVQVPITNYLPQSNSFLSPAPSSNNFVPTNPFMGFTNYDLQLGSGFGRVLMNGQQSNSEVPAPNSEPPVAECDSRVADCDSPEPEDPNVGQEGDTVEQSQTDKAILLLQRALK